MLPLFAALAWADDPAPVSAPAAALVLEGSVQQRFTAAPLPGATVTLTHGTDPPLVVQTDEDGHFRFIGLAPSTVHLSAELAGFAKEELDVELVAGTVATAELWMEAKYVAPADEIVV